MPFWGRAVPWRVKIYVYAHTCVNVASIILALCCISQNTSLGLSQTLMKKDKISLSETACGFD